MEKVRNTREREKKSTVLRRESDPRIKRIGKKPPKAKKEQ
jgi:hypothetical protein